MNKWLERLPLIKDIGVYQHELQMVHYRRKKGENYAMCAIVACTMQIISALSYSIVCKNYAITML